MSSAQIARGFFLETAPDPVFAWFSEPSDGSRAEAAVLFCPPFGWEDFCSYRSRRAWAHHLAGRGHPALRVDLPATGDSPGSPRDPGRLDAWTDAVAGAADWLRATTGCSRVAAIGIGMGGAIALHAAERGAQLDDLVLWGVPARGRPLVRELRAFAMLNAEVDPADAAVPLSTPDPQQKPDGSLEVGGFLLAAETVAALEALDLTAAPLPRASDRRVLMLERDGIAVDRRLCRHLEDSDTTVSVSPGPGYSGMTAHPQEARPPLAEFVTVDAWLAEAPILEQAAPPPRTVPAATPELEFGAPGRTIRETNIDVEQPFGGLPGILAEPAGRPAAPLCAVFLNAGALRRIGPGRMWVDMARGWAERGVPTLRMDLEGIGEADGDGTPYRETAALYVPRFVDQTVAALDELAARGLPPRFVLVGLCSGAYWSFHTAVRDDRVSAAFLINPRVLFWDQTIEDSRAARKATEVFHGSSWRKLLRGDVPISRVGSVARTGIAAALRPRALATTRKRHRQELDQALARLSASDTRLLLAFGGNEPLHYELARDGRFEEFAGHPGIDLVSLPGSDHTLRPISTQRDARAQLDQALEGELRRASSA